jgi:hypothetical protein
VLDFNIGTAAQLAAQLEGVRSGREWRCRCPVHGGHSLSITEGHSGKLIFRCWGADCAFEDIIEALGEEQIYVPSCRIIPAMTQEDDPQRRIARALSLYRSAASASGTIVETYLRSRGITLPVPEVLRFLPYAPHRDRRCYPAMIAPVVDVSGDPIGVHMTYLAPDGRGKYPFVDPAMQRESRGVLRSGAVRLAPHDPQRELISGEGIESVLSCMQMFGRPGLAALSTTGLIALELPSDIRHVAIAVDRDLNGAGQKAALIAYERWIAEGRKVDLLLPSNPGFDFNDELRARTP